MYAAISFHEVRTCPVIGSLRKPPSVSHAGRVLLSFTILPFFAPFNVRCTFSSDGNSRWPRRVPSGIQPVMPARIKSLNQTIEQSRVLVRTAEKLRFHRRAALQDRQGSSQRARRTSALERSRKKVAVRPDNSYVSQWLSQRSPLRDRRIRRVHRSFARVVHRRQAGSRSSMEDVDEEIGAD